MTLCLPGIIKSPSVHTESNGANPSAVIRCFHLLDVDFDHFTDQQSITAPVLCGASTSGCGSLYHMDPDLNVDGGLQRVGWTLER